MSANSARALWFAGYLPVCATPALPTLPGGGKDVLTAGRGLLGPPPTPPTPAVLRATSNPLSTTSEVRVTLCRVRSEGFIPKVLFFPLSSQGASGIKRCVAAGTEGPVPAPGPNACLGHGEAGSTPWDALGALLSGAATRPAQARLTAQGVVQA